MPKTTISCIAYLFLGAVIVRAEYEYFSAIITQPVRILISLLSGLCLTLALISIFGLLRGFGSGESSRKAILDRAHTVLPLDAQASAIGTWSSQQNGLTSKQSQMGNVLVSVVLGSAENLTTEQ